MKHRGWPSGVGALWLVLSACGGDAHPPPAILGDVPLDAGAGDELPSATGHDDGDGGATSDPDDSAPDDGDPGDGDAPGDLPGDGDGEPDGVIDAGQDDPPADTGDAGSSEPDQILGSCTFDLSKVYFLGPTSPIEGYGAIIDIDVPNEPCFGFPNRTVYSPWIDVDDARLSYRNADEEKGSLVADALTWSSGSSTWTLASPEANDLTTPSPTCPGPYGYRLGLLGDPEGGRFLYHCSTLGQDGTQAYWSDGTAAAPYGLSVEAVGRNGVLYAMDSETFDWVTWDGHAVHAVQDMPGSFTISAQAHELGFWVSSYHDRWFVSANGSVTLEGNLAPSPAISNGGESGGVFDRQGRYYEKQCDKDDHWYIVRRPLSPGVSEILYADEGAPAGGSDFAQTPPQVHVYVERGRFVTAP